MSSDAKALTGMVLGGISLFVSGAMVLVVVKGAKNLEPIAQTGSNTFLGALRIITGTGGGVKA